MGHLCGPFLEPVSMQLYGPAARLAGVRLFSLFGKQMDRLLSRCRVVVFVTVRAQPPDHCSRFIGVVLSAVESGVQQMVPR